MIVADQNIVGYLSEAFVRGRVAHAYIVVGQRQQLPQLLSQCAQICMCAAHTADDGCEACKKVKIGVHQDVLRFPKDSERVRINVEDISTLVEESYKRPIDDSPCRVFLLDATKSVVGVGADIWQNKLLKTLEEPTDNIYIFIGVTDEEGLLPTIRSRCQVLKQSKISSAEVCRQLQQKGFEKGICEVVASISSDVLSAEAILSNPAVIRAFQNACNTLENMTSTKNALPFVSAILAEKDTVGQFLEFLTVLLRESIVNRLADGLCLLPSYVDTIVKICANYSLQAAEVCIEKINSAKKRLDDGGNLTVVIDQLVNSVLEVKYRCRI